MLIIVGVLVLAALGGFYMYSSANSAPTAATNGNINSPKANTPKKEASIPPNAPPGAMPPNQAGSPTALVRLRNLPTSNAARVPSHIRQ